MPVIKRACVLIFLVLAGCQPQPAPEEATAEKPWAWPSFDYRQAAREGQAVYRIDSKASRLDVVVRRAGPLARMGHDHAIVVKDLEGWIFLPEEAAKARAELRIPVSRLEVDPAPARSRHGLETEPASDAVAGTRENMLKDVLAADEWPYILAEAAASEGDEVSVTFTVRGQASSHRVPVQFQRSNGRVEARGTLTITHTELGLEPYSTLAGALRVAEEIELHFSLIARALE